MASRHNRCRAVWGGFILLLYACLVGHSGASAMPHDRLSLKHGSSVRLPDTDAGRDAATIGINCPSITDDFRQSSSIKCDGCHVVAVSIVYRLVRQRQTVDEALEQVCDDMMHALLRQKVNGRRFWVPPHKNSGEDAIHVAKTDADAETSKTITLTGMEPRFGAAPTYHDDYEQRVLPCAPYILRRMCFARMEQYEDEVEACVAPHLARATRNKLRSVAITPGSDEEETLLNCVSAALRCQSGDCHERLVLKAREEERIRYLKFEGAFGNQKLPMVEDELTAGLMVRNPYAPGGDKASANELLVKSRHTSATRRQHNSRSDL